MAAEPIKRIAWDTCIVLDYLKKVKVSDDFKWLPPMVSEAEGGNLKIIVSTAAIAETVRIDEAPADGGMAWDKQKEIIRSFYDSDYVEPVAVGRNVAEAAVDLRRLHKLDWADSLHVATAVVTECTHLITRDGKAKKKKSPVLALDNHIVVDGRTLRIRTAEQYHHDCVAAANRLVGSVDGVVRPYGPGVK